MLKVIKKNATTINLLSIAIGFAKKNMLWNMGEKAVRNYMTRDSHKNALKRVRSTKASILFFLQAANQALASLALLLVLLMLFVLKISGH